MDYPSKTHFKAVVLRYLKGIVQFGLNLSNDFNFNLHMYSDVDQARDITNCASTLGIFIFLSKTPVNWSFKKQRTIAKSSIEAEYRAVASALAELNWIKNLLIELHISIKQVPIIYCNNIGATYLCENLVFHSQMKHIAVDFHYMQSSLIRIG